MGPSPSDLIDGAMQPVPVASIRFSDTLRTFAFADRADSSLTEALCVLEDRSYGGLLLGLALPALLLPPGFAAFAGIPLVIVACQLLSGRARPKLPSFIGSGRIAQHRWRNVSVRAAPVLAWAERRVRARLPALLSVMHHRAIGVAALCLSCVLVLPLPIAHTAAALSLIAFGAGLLERDGLAVIVGWLLVLACAAILVAMLIGVQLVLTRFSPVALW